MLHDQALKLSPGLFCYGFQLNLRICILYHLGLFDHLLLEFVSKG